MFAFFSFWDPYWWVMIPGMLLALWAQMRLSSTYSRYREVGTDRRITGADAAREILDRNGMSGVEVFEVPGHLTDHYDPLKKSVFLSSENFHSTSVAAVGVAAHEVGHAIQHKEAYGPLGLRMALVGVTNFASNASMWIIIAGMVIGGAWSAKLLWGGVILFSVVAFFQAVTLPVEFDASRRAKVQLLRYGIITNRENADVDRVLSAAALTYVAALVSALLTVLKYVMLARSRDDER
jgi:Zn-dependent membrane protease YugP